MDYTDYVFDPSTDSGADNWKVVEQPDTSASESAAEEANAIALGNTTVTDGNGEVIRQQKAKENMEKLASLSPPFYGMSGSGGTTFALFGHDELARWAADKLRKDGLDCLVCRTIDPSGKRRR